MLDLAFDDAARAWHSAAGSTTSRDPVSANAGLLARMLDVFDYGVLLVLDEGQVLFANRVARNELDEHHPLQLVDQELRVRCQVDVAALKLAIAAARNKGLQKLLTLGQRRGGEVTLSVIPMHEPGTNGRAAAMLIFGKRQVCDELSTEAFARNHKLTPAELRVLKQLCAGRSPNEIARSQGVALCTVRTQIGELRQKTGAESIGALIRQVDRLPPLQSVFRIAN